ncbi:MAG: hypothetical protein U9Q99_00960, partial [Nanoarchaeota archaeon]|nr:hypothetical protein [Nanoarchaeota archaeon]
FEKNQPLIDYLSGELKNLGYEFSPENPISIKGAKILEDKNKKNKYGLKLDLENAIIENDLRFVSGTKIIDLNGTEKKLRTKTAGLSRLFLIVNDLDSGYDILSYSGRCGRVVVSKQVF